MPRHSWTSSIGRLTAARWLSSCGRRRMLGHPPTSGREWSDLLAEGGLKRSAVSLARVPVRFCSMRPLLPTRGWLRWAMVRARRVVCEWLVARSPRVVLAEHGDLALGSFATEDERLAAAVRTGFVLQADRGQKANEVSSRKEVDKAVCQDSIGV